MTDFLIKIFVKNHQQTRDKYVRQAYGYLGGFVGIFANLLLCSFKLIIGFWANSIAVMADGVNNLSDTASSVITLIGFKITNKPADREHPFGHGRIEYISAMIVSFMVILVGFEFVKSSINRIMHPEILKYDWLTLSVLFASILVKLWLCGFNKKIGKSIGSKAMEATSFDSLSDVVTTSVVLVSLPLSRWIILPIDGYVGLLVAAFIIYSGINLIKDALNPLLGQAPEAELVNDIIDRVLAYDGIIGMHDMIVHNYGPSRCIVSLHAEVPCSMNIMKAHDIIDKAEQEISEELDIHLVMHMDPINTNDELVQKIQSEVMAVIHKFSEKLTIHDFRIVGNDGLKNLIFDMVVPHEIAEKDEKKLAEDVAAEIKRSYPSYHAIISIDRQYSIFK